MAPSFLVLTNLSETAKLAARYAAVLGEPLQVRLALLSLYHHPLLDPDLLTVTAARAYRSQAETMHELQAVAEHLPAAAEVQVAIGTLHAAVADAVADCQPLLLAMGLSMEHDLLDQLLHNQALPVLRATRRPLLLVPEGAAAPRLPQRVLMAVDAEPFTLNAASRHLGALLGSWPAEYTVAHVRTRHETLAEPGRMALADVRASKLLPPGTALDLCEVHHLAPASGVLQALEDTDADLLILVARPRSFLGRLFHRSITAQVLRRCQVPVLLLPAEDPGLPE
ncbi:universal stress protein [Hymenobacter sp. DH14]|uniref:Universal stress protein n=1 Tax=Hymenobacter cyanobacteriorum TaxID=2926463 RepID=A0A9X1VKD9_9BACT|nr:universal stress protein [Hymenobacter cyanobacteriorum]MCI1188630.1 universal stress protein [Hymenobacter cyanobacteriorum]